MNDPHTEEVIGRVPEGTEADIDAAVAAARRAFDEGPWPRMAPAERAEIVDTIRYAVVTQACWSRPCRSSPMVRIAVPTTVWSSAARNMPAIRP